MKIFLNGDYINEHQAKAFVNDRGTLLGDGIFETICIYAGKPLALKAHYERLQKSASVIHLPLSLSLDEFNHIATQLISINGLQGKTSVLRLTVTRGPAPRGTAVPTVISPTVLATLFPLPHINTGPSKAIISTIRRNEFSPLATIKSLCYLENILVKQEAINKGADEGIMLNTQGSVACASVANIFIITEQGIVAPGCQEGALPGITKKAIFKICKKNQLTITEGPVSITQLMAAKEVFITNSLIGIMSITHINGRPVGQGTVGQLTVQLQKLYRMETQTGLE